MNICPNCGAELDDNARFCLRCMTSLNPKRVIPAPRYVYQRWLPMAAAVLALVMVVVALWLSLPQEKMQSGNAFSASAVTQTGGLAGEKTTNRADDTTTGAQSILDGADNTADGTKGTAASVTTGSRSATTTAPSGNVSSRTTLSTTKSTTATSKDKSTTDRGNGDVADTIYLYRDARAGDDFSVFADLENAVVITGVTQPTDNGVYIIPETLGGKRVVAIMSNAFCGDLIRDTVKTVVVPATVKTIWNYAFATCYRLTDIYFLGNAVYTESNAFADPTKRIGTLTIHCSATCTDRALRYYKDAAHHYQAQYKELSDAEIKTLYGGGGQ